MASWAAIYGHFCEVLSLKPWHLVPSSSPHDLEYIRTIINHIARPVDTLFARRDFWGLRGKPMSSGLWLWSRCTCMRLTGWRGTRENLTHGMDSSHVPQHGGLVGEFVRGWTFMFAVCESEFGSFRRHIDLKVVGRWNTKIHKVIQQNDVKYRK